MKPSTYQIKFTPTAIKSIKKLDQATQTRIKKKLIWLIQQKNPFKFAESLTDHKIGEYRFRIGGYRVIFDVSQKTIIVLLVGHRKKIYK